LDNEHILRQFEELEQKIEKLVDVCKSLEATNSELSDKVKLLEEELRGQIEAQENYTQEKARIRSKIDGLLARLEEVTEVS
jgi:cell division protein FtsB